MWHEYLHALTKLPLTSRMHLPRLPASAAPHHHSRCRYVQQYDETQPSTYKNRNLLVMTMDQLYADFGLAEATIEFIGHAIALYPDVAYRKRPALPTVKRIALYYQSLTRFANLKSPYIYPLYGLGELPQVCPARPPPEPRGRLVCASAAQSASPVPMALGSPVQRTAQPCLPVAADVEQAMGLCKTAEAGQHLASVVRCTDQSPRLQAPPCPQWQDRTHDAARTGTRGCGLAPD